MIQKIKNNVTFGIFFRFWMIKTAVNIKTTAVAINCPCVKLEKTCVERSKCRSTGQKINPSPTRRLFKKVKKESAISAKLLFCSSKNKNPDAFLKIKYTIKITA